MIIGDRLRTLREEKRLSQGDIQKRTGLLRCYISRVECGHTTPSLGTLEKMARALEMPLYQVLYENDESPRSKPTNGHDKLWGNEPKEAQVLLQFRRVFGRMKNMDRNLLMAMARNMASRKNRSADA